MLAATGFCCAVVFGHLEFTWQRSTPVASIPDHRTFALYCISLGAFRKGYHLVIIPDISSRSYRDGDRVVLDALYCLLLDGGVNLPNLVIVIDHAVNYASSPNTILLDDPMLR